MTAGSSAAAVHAALVPLHSATATADRAAARAGLAAAVPAAPASGMMIQGAMACGRYSPEYSPSIVSAMGDRAYAKPAAARVHGAPMPSRPASRAVPAKAAMSTA